jgi:hypothetical protein
MRSNRNLKAHVCKKYPTNEQRQWWWEKFAKARRRRLWRISEQQNHRCCYCSLLTWMFDGLNSEDRKYKADRLPGMSDKRQATVDHFIPASKGGSEHPLNTVMACFRCNFMRGAMDALEFWEIMNDREKYIAWRRERQRVKVVKVRSEKRLLKERQFAYSLALLMHLSPVADCMASQIVLEIVRHSKVSRNRNQTVAQHEKDQCSESSFPRQEGRERTKPLERATA